MSHKRQKIPPPAGVQLGLIITPMLDMSFQILAFFIMTYHPSALEGHIPGSLTPPEEYLKKSKDNLIKPPEDPLSLPEDKLDPALDDAITIRIKASVAGQSRKEGTPDQIFTRRKVDNDDELLAGSDVGDFDKDVLPRLEAKLKELAKKSQKANLKIAGDGGLEYQYMLKVYDVGKRAGFEKVHFVPPQIKSKLKIDRK